jgi:RNA polymerase sigma-70 factor (ECF subfamily)
VDTRDDEALVAAWRQDREGPAGRAAAQELFARYRTRAYAWCHRMVRDHDRALDLAQEGLLDAFRGLAGFDGRARFSSWLFRIVRNRCLTALRPRSLRRDEALEPDELWQDGRDPLEWLATQQEEAAVQEAIRDRLDPLEQQVLWLRVGEDMGVEHITRALGIRQASGARGVLQSARRKLRAALGARFGEV